MGVMEAAVVFDAQGAVLHWHLPAGRSGGALPDSRDLWEILWAHRAVLGGVAHTHPWVGPARPSRVDTTTWSACEAGLGRRLLWPVVTFSEIVYFAHHAESDSYRETTPGPAALAPDTLDALRRHSRTPRSAGE